MKFCYSFFGVVMSALAAGAAPITNYWIGATSGGAFSNSTFATDWEAKDSSKKTVEVSFEPGRVYDLSKLEDTATMDVNIPDFQPSAIIFKKHSNEDTWTLKSSGSGGFKRVSKIDFIVPADCFLDWNAKFENSYGSSVKLAFSGGGTLRLKSTEFNPFQCVMAFNDSRLEITEAARMLPVVVQLEGDEARAQIDRDVTVYGLRSTRGTPTFDLNDHSLTISARYFALGASSYGGNIIGESDDSYVLISDGSFQTFTNAKVYPHIRLANGNLDLADGAEFRGLELNVANDGRVALSNSTKLAFLKGDGFLGGVDMAPGTTLTVTGNANKVDFSFAGSLAGDAKFVLDATNAVMTVSGSNRHTGGTEVKRGKLAVASSVTDDDPLSSLPQPVAHYAFDDESNPGKDSSTNHYDLVTPGEITVPLDVVKGSSKTYNPNAVVITNDIPGAYGKCGYFSRSALTANAFPARIPTGNKSFSISVRFQRCRDLIGPSMIELGDYSPANSYVRMMTGGSPAQLKMEWLGDGNSHGNSSGSFTIDGFMPVVKNDPRSWVHFVYTYDATTRQQIGYVGGVQTGAVVKSSAFNLAAKDFKLGFTTQSRSWGGENEKFFNGYLDDVRVYDVVLTADEVRTLALQLQNGKLPTVLPEEGEVTVKPGATLSFTSGTDHRLSSLVCTGTLEVATGARVTVENVEPIAALAGGGAFRVDGAEVTVLDATGFTGVLEVTNGLIKVEGTSPATVKILADGRIETSGSGLTNPIAVDEDFTINVKADGSSTPVVKTAGKVTIPSVAHFAFDSEADVAKNRTRQFDFITGVFDEPDLRQWTYLGSSDKFTTTIKCRENGDGTRTVYVHLNFKGTTFVVR